MDIEKFVSDALKQLTGNQDLIKEFMANPAKTLESKLGIKVPEEQVNAVIDAIKAKLTTGDAVKEAKSFWDKIKGIFGK